MPAQPPQLWVVEGSKNGNLVISYEKRPKSNGVTLVSNIASGSDQLLTELKLAMGTAGKVLPGGKIEVHGDVRERVERILKKHPERLRGVSGCKKPTQAPEPEPPRVRLKPRHIKMKNVVIGDWPSLEVLTTPLPGATSFQNDVWHEVEFISKPTTQRKPSTMSDTALEAQLDALGMVPSKLPTVWQYELKLSRQSKRGTAVKARQDQRTAEQAAEGGGMDVRITRASGRPGQPRADGSGWRQRGVGKHGGGRTAVAARRMIHGALGLKMSRESKEEEQQFYASNGNGCRSTHNSARRPGAGQAGGTASANQYSALGHNLPLLSSKKVLGGKKATTQAYADEDCDDGWEGYEEYDEEPWGDTRDESWGSSRIGKQENDLWEQWDESELSAVEIDAAEPESLNVAQVVAEMGWVERFGDMVAEVLFDGVLEAIDLFDWTPAVRSFVQLGLSEEDSILTALEERIICQEPVSSDDDNHELVAERVENFPHESEGSVQGVEGCQQDSQPLEWRIDPADGNWYTRAEFVAEYGDSGAWEAAADLASAEQLVTTEAAAAMPAEDAGEAWQTQLSDLVTEFELDPEMHSYVQGVLSDVWTGDTKGEIRDVVLYMGQLLASLGVPEKRASGVLQAACSNGLEPTAPIAIEPQMECSDDCVSVESWTCSVCTLVNSQDLLSCAACDSPHPHINDIIK